MIRKAQAVLNEQDIKVYNDYVAAMKKDLHNSGLPIEKQEEMLEAFSCHELFRLATNRLGAQYNKLANEVNDISKRYAQEPDDRRAEALKKQYNSKKQRASVVSQQRDVFLKEFNSRRKKVIAYDSELTNALINAGYKINPRGRGSKKEDMRQSPFAKVKTYTPRSK